MVGSWIFDLAKNEYKLGRSSDLFKFVLVRADDRTSIQWLRQISLQD